jgi:hypothetical protein
MIKGLQTVYILEPCQPKKFSQPPPQTALRTDFASAIRWLIRRQRSLYPWQGFPFIEVVNAPEGSIGSLRSKQA